MTFKLVRLLSIVYIAFVWLVGCNKAQNMVIKTIPSATPAADDAASDRKVSPVKLVVLVDYPLDGKALYLEWAESVVPILRAPEEINAVISYENFYGGNPHQLVEFQFKSYLDAAMYLNRPEIAAIFADLPNHTNQASVNTFIQRTDYGRNGDTRQKIKVVYFIDYPLGGKDKYLEWVVSGAPVLITPKELKRIAAYDNYYGESPHRLLEFEFDSLEDANRYEERADIDMLRVQLPDRSSKVSTFLFVLQSDDIPPK